MRIECAACALLLLLPCGRVPGGYGALARAALAGHRIAGRRRSIQQQLRAGRQQRGKTDRAALPPALAGDMPLWPTCTGDRGPAGDCADGLKAKTRVIVFHFLVA